MKAILPLFLVLMLCGCGTAQSGALIRARSGIDKGKYAFALRRLSDAEYYKEPKPAMKAEIIYLKAICFRGLGHEPESKALFEHVMEHYPQTEFAALAKAQLSLSR